MVVPVPRRKFPLRGCRPDWSWARRAVKAGLADSTAIPASDPVGATFLELTGVAKDAENRLASVIGPEDARSAVYGNGSCGRTAEFTSASGALAQ